MFPFSAPWTLILVLQRRTNVLRKMCRHVESAGHLTRDRTSLRFAQNCPGKRYPVVASSPLTQVRMASALKARPASSSPPTPPTKLRSGSTTSKHLTLLVPGTQQIGKSSCQWVGADIAL